MLAAGIVAVAALVRSLLIPGLRETPYVIFYPAVMITALYGGFWPGLLAVLLSGIGSATWFGPGEFVQFSIPGRPIGLIVYMAGSVIIVSICSRLIKARERISAEAHRLRESERSLEAEIAKHRRTGEELKRLGFRNQSILESAGEGIWGVDTSGTVTFINRAGASSLGYDVHELIGRPSHASWHYKRPDGAPYPSEACPIYAAYKDGVDHTGEETFWRKDGSGFPVDFTSRPLFEEGRITGAVITFRDITGRKREEEERERLIGELQRSNRELEQFAYVASHDLQEPLRMVGSYTTLLQKRYKERLDERAHEYIRFAVDGAQRMQNLIEGLLAYSRITRRGGRFKQVDFNKVFLDAVSNLSSAIREYNAEVTKEQLPTLSGDETQLVQLLQNLIGNGIKYAKPDSRPRVHISAESNGNQYVFSVKDNGIGIEPEYYERIFEIFQRLHARGRYPGTGIGLAICKRIVERHHGLIWVESVPGEGSTFFFTVPNRPGRGAGDWRTGPRGKDTEGE
jgi:PAS domain S-box-containing protein